MNNQYERAGERNEGRRTHENQSERVAWGVLVVIVEVRGAVEERSISTSIKESEKERDAPEKSLQQRVGDRICRIALGIGDVETGESLTEAHCEDGKENEEDGGLLQHAPDDDLKDTKAMHGKRWVGIWQEREGREKGVKGRREEGREKKGGRVESGNGRTIGRGRRRSTT
jgi:hypothetical protein